jgi:hypothetical protein
MLFSELDRQELGPGRESVFLCIRSQLSAAPGASRGPMRVGPLVAPLPRTPGLRGRSRVSPIRPTEALPS